MIFWCGLPTMIIASCGNVIIVYFFLLYLGST
nr:MAG TPA: hypothetical protein [Caudoviricetes sp.]DAX20997.1 MAG TPA: hypothetical protein [Caudoviricetes sp.]